MPKTPPETDLDALRSDIERCPPASRPVLERRLRGLTRRRREGRPADRGTRALAEDVKRLRAGYEARRGLTLAPDFDLDLPVLARRADIEKAIADHQVVVICGETGSGKSTQLPKICLAMGRGIDGRIAHTQPRRIAARSLAARVAEETGTAVGAGVGFRIRFSDHVSPATRVKLATDGMLLAETQSDPELREYDTIIIDEAHERSLNIDFLLGYLRDLLPRRPDLKVIITSATIDPERFSRHFGGAPILNVSGRTFPVETRYRPLASDDEDERDRSMQQGILDAVDELAGEGPGDILVFLPGERDIRESAERLRKHHPPRTEILPLYGRLSAAEQQRVFAPHGQRRIVLATNVAETSLTVPGIRYVVDSGLARISRYSFRTKVQRLPVEPVSQASANQRAGRCGREAPGVCIRLYSEEDFRARPEFTDPEILRTNLASVILQMKYLRLGDIEAFPFIEPPDPRYVRDGLRLLHELHALDDRERLTRSGQRLARLPIDPRLARMLLAGDEERALAETLVIVAALSIQDPRERPMDARAAADEAQSDWRHERSDFLGLLSLWADFEKARRERSASKLRAWCRDHYLSFVRMREWRDVHRQLREMVTSMGLRENEREAEYVAIHRALLTGLLSNVALRADDNEYQGPRGLKLRIFPGSGVARKKPKWIMAAELVETSRVFARSVAEVRPEWVEALARHLVARRHYDPFWEEGKARVAGYEDVSLYGLPLVSGRKINFSRVDRAAAREVFIREALVGGRFDSRAPCLAHNRELIERLETLEAKSRRRDVLVDEGVLAAFYDERLGAEVTDGPSFEKWVRDRDNDAALRVTEALLRERDAVEVTRDDYPDELTVNGVAFPLEYHFDPTREDDGVTLVVPLAALNQLPPERFEWLVPGLLHDKVTALIRGLPKAVRKNFVPAPDFASALIEAMPEGEGSLVEAMARELRRMTGVDIPPESWDAVSLPAHLGMNFRVVDGRGEALAGGRDLVDLKRRLAEHAAESFSGADLSDQEHTGLRTWRVGDLPEHVAVERGGLSLRGYPALVDEGETVALRLLDSAERAEQEHRGGVRRLAMLTLADQARYLRQKLPGTDRLGLLYGAVGKADALRADIVAASFDATFFADSLPRREADFRATLDRHRAELVPTATRLVELLGDILERHKAIRQRLKGAVALDRMQAMADIREHLDTLVYPGFVATTPMARLAEFPRYLAGIEKRLERLDRDPGRDAPGREAMRPWWEAWRERRERHQRKGIEDPALERFRWLLEEYRISLFAQDLGTREKVSEKRLKALWDGVR